MRKKDEFLSLFVKGSPSLFSYILTLVPCYADAEDILQETATIMWTKFDTFEKGSNFSAWARKIARYIIANHYKTRHEQFCLDRDTLNVLSIEAARLSDLLEDKKVALRNCLKKLSPSDLQLIQKRYCQNIAVPKIAEEMNRPAITLYKRIAFIYTILQSCISRTIAVW